MGKRLTLEGQALTVKGRGKPLQFQLDDLRLVYLVTYYNPKVSILANSTSHSVSVIDLDSTGEEGASMLSSLTGILASARGYELGQMHLCLADFGSASVQVSFKDIKRSRVDLFPQLALGTAARLQKRKAWLSTRPSVTLFGGGARSAVVDERGFAVGKKFIAWADVGVIKIQTQDNAFFKTAHLLVVPAGVSTGAFGLKQLYYSLNFVKVDRAELYYAECTFWRMVAAAKASTSPLTERLTTLKDLHDQGVLSDEKYAEAKGQAIAELT